MNGEAFTSSEIMRACQYNRRTLEVLKREHLAPEPVAMKGRGGAAHFDYLGLSRFVATDAFSKATGSIISGARLSQAIMPELDATYLGVPWGAKDVQRELLAQGQNVPSEDQPLSLFWAAAKNGLTDGYQAKRNDFRLLIADNRYVFQARSETMPFASAFAGDDGSAVPLLELGHGSGPEIVVSRTQVEMHDAEPKPLIQKLRNAQVLVQVNLSLSMRAALARLTDLRTDRVMVGGADA